MTNFIIILLYAASMIVAILIHNNLEDKLDKVIKLLKKDKE